LFVCKWAESFGFIQVQRIYRQVVSEEPFENPNHYGDDSAHGGANSKNPAAAELGLLEELKGGRTRKVSLE
jgi:hypothetical protein